MELFNLDWENKYEDRGSWNLKRLSFKIFFTISINSCFFFYKI
jgi:hypothetical protein